MCLHIRVGSKVILNTINHCNHTGMSFHYSFMRHDNIFHFNNLIYDENNSVILLWTINYKRSSRVKILNSVKLAVYVLLFCSLVFRGSGWSFLFFFNMFYSSSFNVIISSWFYKLSHRCAHDFYISLPSLTLKSRWKLCFRSSRI